MLPILTIGEVGVNIDTMKIQKKTDDQLVVDDKVPKRSVLNIKDGKKHGCRLWQLPENPQTLFFQRAREAEVYKVGYSIGLDPIQPNAKWFCFEYRDIEMRTPKKVTRLSSDDCVPILEEISGHLEKQGYAVLEGDL